MNSWRPPQSLLLIALLVPCLLIIIPAVMAYRSKVQVAEESRWVTHTVEVQRELQHVLALLTEAESQQRGYLLIPTAQNLAFYEAPLRAVPDQVRRIQGLTLDNSSQRMHLAELERLVNAKMEFMEQTVALEQAGKGAEALTLVGSGKGRQTMDAVRKQLAALDQEESLLLEHRQSRLVAHATANTVHLFILVGVMVTLAAAFLVVTLRLSKAEALVKICAWSKTVEYRGEWLSFDEYLRKRFQLEISHGLSPAEAERQLQQIRQEAGESKKPRVGLERSAS